MRAKHLRLPICCLLVAGCGSQVPAPGAIAPGERAQTVWVAGARTHRVLFKGRTPGGARDALAAAGAHVVEELPELGLTVAEVPESSGPVAAARFRRMPGVAYAEADFRVRATLVSPTPRPSLTPHPVPTPTPRPRPTTAPTAQPTPRPTPTPTPRPAALGPNDPMVSLQWGLGKVQARAAWTLTQGSRAVKIAVVDSGIDRDHPELKTQVVDAVNFSDSPSLTDLFGHGTHVAGIAAAATNNGLGVAGLGYNTSLMSVKVLDDDGSGSYAAVIKGILYATDHGAKVICMSLAGSEPSEALADAVAYAASHEVVVVAAAGNDASAEMRYPAGYTGCIAVAATDRNDQLTNFTSYGEWVDVAAPGVDILSTLPTHKTVLGINYGHLDGSSMAAPLVAGEAALLWTRVLSGGAAEVHRRLVESCDPIDATGSGIAYGRINAFQAIKGP